MSSLASLHFSPLGWLAVAVVLAISLIRKRRIGLVWLAALGYAVACQIPIYLMRSSRFTALELAQTLRYLPDLVVVLTLLAAVGLYGVLSYLTTQRTPDIGLRIALGAQRSQLLQLVLFEGLRPALIGLILGVAASALATQLLRSMLYGTQPLDPAAFAGAAAMLMAVAVMACLIPAWRASRIDPIQALRTE